MLVYFLLIEGTQVEFCTYSIFNSLLWNGWRVFAELFPMFHPIGTTPDDFPGRPGDSPVIAPTFSANQKTAQYALRAVPGGLSLVGVFVKIAALVLFALNHEVFIKAND